jgi:hypothetical protein
LEFSQLCNALYILPLPAGWSAVFSNMTGLIFSSWLSARWPPSFRLKPADAKKAVLSELHRIMKTTTLEIYGMTLDLKILMQAIACSQMPIRRIGFGPKDELPQNFLDFMVSFNIFHSSSSL